MAASSAARRAGQGGPEELSESLLAALRGDPDVARRLADLEKRVGRRPPRPAAAADAVRAAFLGRTNDPCS